MMRMSFFQKNRFIEISRHRQNVSDQPPGLSGFFWYKILVQVSFCTEHFLFLSYSTYFAGSLFHALQTAYMSNILNCKDQEVIKLYSLILFISTIRVSRFLFLNGVRVCGNFYFCHFYDFKTFIKSPCLQISSMALKI